MIHEASLWTYSLAPDVTVEPCENGAFLRTPTGKKRMSDPDELRALDLLQDERRNNEAELCDRLGPGGAAMLFRLDRLGLLTRTLNSQARPLVSCIPLRPPPAPPPQRPPDGLLQLSPLASARAQDDLVSLDVPGAWARIAVHDRGLLTLLYDFAARRTAAEVAASTAGHGKDAILAVLAVMSWCGLFEQTDEPVWSEHDLLLHTRTRGGYARALLGKTMVANDAAAQPALSANVAHRLVLERPDPARLCAEDPPHAQVSERRRSVRQQGSEPLDLGQLSEFLFRTLHERGGRRPYPSGGACYPLTAYLAIHRCLGVTSGLYAYDQERHELVMVAANGPGLVVLLANAAAAADIAEPPQVLLVLAARFARTRRVYGDLSYSLILKEVGAVFQVAMMAGAAMGLGICPIGSGDSLLFSELAGVDPLAETSVGEMVLGSLEAPSSGRRGPD